MSATLPITHAQLGELLASLRFGVDPSDLHGSLTGYLGAGGHADARDWLAALQLETDEAEAAAAAASAPLQQLFRECSAWLDDPDLRFEPLLPAADTPLDVRADALVEWCRGFLGGCGLAGALSHRRLSADANEILADFHAIAATRFETTDDAEDERAFADVLDFVRTAAALLHRDVNAAGPRGGHALH